MKHGELERKFAQANAHFEDSQRSSVSKISSNAQLTHKQLETKVNIYDLCNQINKSPPRKGRISKQKIKEEDGFENETRILN
jgi:hypothetical protein